MGWVTTVCDRLPVRRRDLGVALLLLGIAVSGVWDSGGVDWLWMAIGLFAAGLALAAMTVSKCGVRAWEAFERAAIDTRLAGLGAVVTLFVGGVFVVVPSGVPRWSFLAGGIAAVTLIELIAFVVVRSG